MSTRKIGAVIFGLGALIVIGFTIYKISTGKDVGFNEILSIACLVMIFLTNITWGTKEEKDGILQEEELGKRITEKSSKAGYFLLTFFILIAAVADQLIHGTTSIFLLLLLGLAMITLPFIEFIIARKYQ